MNRKELQKLQADDEKYSDMYSDLSLYIFPFLYGLMQKKL